MSTNNLSSLNSNKDADGTKRTSGAGPSGSVAVTTKTVVKAVATTPAAVVNVAAGKATAVAQPATGRNNKVTGAALNTAGH